MAKRKSVNTFHELPVPDKGQSIRWTGVSGAGVGLSLVESVARSKKDLIILARDNRDAQRIFNEVQFFAGHYDITASYLPDVETLPYDLESTHTALISERASVIHSLPNKRRTANTLSIFVTPVVNALRYLSGKSHWLDKSFSFRPGDEINKDQLRETLITLGYTERFKVTEVSEFAIRNEIVDIYPSGGSGPCRMVIESGKVARISHLKTTSQLSDEALSVVNIMPACEVPTDAETIKRFSHRFWNSFEDARQDPFYQSAKKGVAHVGIEAYLPLLTDDVVSLFEYLSPNVSVALSESCMEYIDEYLGLVVKRYAELTESGSRNLLTPEALWMTKDRFVEALEKRGFVTLSADGGEDNDFGGESSGFSRKGNLSETIAALQPWFAKAPKILLCMRSEARREQMELICLMAGVTPVDVSGWDEFVGKDVEVGITVCQMDEGGWWPAEGILIITEKEIFGQPIFQKDESDLEDDEDFLSFQDLDGLEIDDPIVHMLYGVGRFKGLKTIDQDNHVKDYVMIEYAEQATVYVDSDELAVLARYSGIDNDKAPLDIMGSEAWLKGLKSAYASARSTASTLLKLYAEREMIVGEEMSEPEYQFERFVNEFPFQETQDQRNAVIDIINDLTSPRPMDRVVTGDVGFGKTEVAMRAAFLAADNGYQVAVIVPTTLLAYQHFETFKQRFQIFNMRIELLSRGTASEQRRILKDLADGEINIVIGTHKLVQKDVVFNNLGLLVIDEEHRFGVAQKEKIRTACVNVNTLSMTATPIPRTLSMALHGLRDASIIATPPSKRLAIRTFVMDWTEDKIKEAIDREILRNGQVFYVDNRIETIEETADKLRTLFPGLRIAVAHGQMGEVAMEKIMAAFYRHEFDILVCTTIIETGIDVPNANTIIIERANHFGLAQLHQLRGRVGRSNHQAYAYLCTDSKKALTDAAGQRLQAMQSASSLGQGFLLANYDLEIRGAGELLGEEQSGNIQAIGYALYTRLLERAIESLKQGEDIADEAFAGSKTSSVRIGMESYIPHDYVTDPATRLVLYRRIGAAVTDENQRRLKDEILDRFGPIPETLDNCFYVSEIKKAMEIRGIKEAVLSTSEGALTFYPEYAVNAASISTQLLDIVPEITENGYLTARFDGSEGSTQKRVDALMQQIEYYQEDKALLSWL